MQRFLIGGLAAVAIVLATVGIFVGVQSQLESSELRAVKESVRLGAKQFEQVSRLEGLDFAAVVTSLARRDSANEALGDENEESRIQAAFAEVEAINHGLDEEGRKADIVALLDINGQVVTRDLNPNAMRGEDLAGRYPAVGVALKGQAVHDVWNFSGRPTRVAIAPIFDRQNAINGALLVGYVISHQGVREMRELLGLNLAVFSAGKMVTSSFTRSDNREDGAKLAALAGAVIGEGGLASDALASDSVTDVKVVEIEGVRYAAAAAASPGNYSDETTGAVVVASLAAAEDLASTVSSKLLILGALCLVIMLVAAVLTAKRFINPLDKIELGVAEIINGNIDYQFSPVGPDFEGLSNGLNVMLARLLGREELGEDDVVEDDDEQWKAERMVIFEGDGAPAGANASALAQESEAAYYPRLYNEYVNALRSHGERTENVPVQLFTAKLRLVEVGLKRKWNCRLVRFQLVEEGGQPVFQAVRI